MQPTQFSFDAIGMSWTIDVFEKLTKEDGKALFQQIFSFIDEFDKTYSRFRKDSLVTQMSKESGTYQLPENSREIFDLYKKLYDLTGGLFTPFIGSVLEEAGYDASYSLKPKILHKPLSWDEAIEYSFSKLIVKKPVLLDFGAAGKGYLVDLVSRVLLKSEITSYCIDAGGDINYHSHLPHTLRVGLEHPEDGKKVIGVAEISNQSICGSSGNRRKWKNFHHIINPQTLTSPTDIRATWVIHPSTIIADALATCLFLVSPQTLSEKFTFEYLIVYNNLSIDVSDKFPAELYINRREV